MNLNEKRSYQFVVLIITFTLLFGMIPFAARDYAHALVVLGKEKHLFLDNYMLSTVTNAKLTVNPPVVKELVLIADKPWDKNGVTPYATVFWDSAYNQYRMYYAGISYDASPVFNLCLATSTDGITWTKPNLGAVSWGGNTNNNIVIAGQREGTVLIDPNAVASRKYAYLSSEQTALTKLFYSSDGIHFTMDPTSISSHWSDSQISSFWDDQLLKYVHYPRVYNGLGRTTARVVTDNMNSVWPAGTPTQIVMTRDASDPADMDLYTNSAQKYALAKNAYLAFPTPYYHYDGTSRSYLAKGGNDGVIETQLATSRDGITWTRYRVPYAPLFEQDGKNIKINMVFPGMLYDPNRIVQYAGGYTFTHGDPTARTRLTGSDLGGFYRLVQRPDGFISMDFDYAGGTVITEPITFDGDYLALNLNTSASGEGRVALLDANGAEIPGFGLADSRWISGNHLEKIVTWANGTYDVRSLAGTTVKVKFEFRGTKLYSFQFKEKKTRTMNFTADPAWEGSGNRTYPQNFGWSNTNNNGLGAGEIGGTVYRSSVAWYGDNTVGTLSMDMPLSISGTMNIINAGTGNDGNMMIGFFNPTVSNDMLWPPKKFIGFRTDGVNVLMYYRSSNQANAIVSNSVFTATQGTSFAFTFAYNPGNGIMTMTFNGGAAQTLQIPLTDIYDGAEFNRFGIFSLAIPGNTFDQTSYLDNLTYSIK